MAKYFLSLVKIELGEGEKDRGRQRRWGQTQRDIEKGTEGNREISREKGLGKREEKRAEGKGREERRRCY